MPATAEWSRAVLAFKKDGNFNTIEKHRIVSPENKEKIISLAKDSDHLFIEAAFLEVHKNIAAEKYHLTARQAGTLAAKSGAKQFTIFHFSPRYVGQESLLYQEATEAYELHC